ncbi:MAG: methylmalonyl Co-A mutase-associated GTPase MeaB [Alphaproteobacteria bacterium]
MGPAKPTEAAPESLAEAVVAGDRRALARAITLVESSRAEHRDRAAALLAALLPQTGRSVRIGISGVPGVGKSSFVERFGLHAIGQGHRVAVLAVDPTSRVSGGSILGDKTRMEALGRHRDAFIRPSPAGRTLGGVARRTREALLVCEAAGFDVVLVETVGVGQSETAVAEMTDLFLLLLLPGGGDELQGLKKGIVEIADIVLVNKADGDLTAAARHSAADYRNAIHMLRRAHPDWRVPVRTCSALTGEGIAEAWDTIGDYRRIMGGNGAIAARRQAQALDWMWSEIEGGLIAALRAHPAVQGRLAATERAVRDGRETPSAAARSLIRSFLGMAADRHIPEA